VPLALGYSDGMSPSENDPMSQPDENTQTADPAAAPAPPANPPADEDSIEKGEEQLDRIVGN
jgi:hypothetical protein